MDYEEFIHMIEENGLKPKATAQTVFLRPAGCPAQILVRWGRYNNGDALMCYIDLQLNADGTLKDVVGIPLELVTPEKVTEFITSWKRLYTC